MYSDEMGLGKTISDMLSVDPREKRPFYCDKCGRTFEACRHWSADDSSENIQQSTINKRKDTMQPEERKPERKPLYLRLEDFRIIRDVFDSLEEANDISEEERQVSWKVKKIIGNIEGSILRKRREENACSEESSS